MMSSGFVSFEISAGSWVSREIVSVTLVASSCASAVARLLVESSATDTFESTFVCWVIILFASFSVSVDFDSSTIDAAGVLVSVTVAVTDSILFLSIGSADGNSEGADSDWFFVADSAEVKLLFVDLAGNFEVVFTCDDGVVELVSFEEGTNFFSLSFNHFTINGLFCKGSLNAKYKDNGIRGSGKEPKNFLNNEAES
ncbi:unnamed protein product [[Candida] boidinii]|nr:unnamed protein product [[Candida] boidinii]